MDLVPDTAKRSTLSVRRYIHYYIDAPCTSWMLSWKHLRHHGRSSNTIVLHVCVNANMAAILFTPRYGDNVVNYSDKPIYCRELAQQILRHFYLSYQLKSSSGRLNKISAAYLYFLVDQVQAFWLQQPKIRASSKNKHKKIMRILSPKP